MIGAFGAFDLEPGNLDGNNVRVLEEIITARLKVLRERLQDLCLDK